MRSSPKFLVANRREGDAQPSSDRKVIWIGKRHRRDDPDHEGLELRLSVSYKTLAVIFALFNVVGHIVDTVSRRDISHVSETLWGLFPF
uniref:Uncharacterized protein n=1 Tax=Leviviridae sp. TaxID=2027243 RepID=A0A514CZ41_9VIRU|nr:MAG: hypothetical protein H2Bulk361168e332_000002 [Leviviridae sp.]